MQFTNRQLQIILEALEIASQTAFLLYEADKVYSIDVLPTGNRESRHLYEF
jgi:hypothetical protein